MLDDFSAKHRHRASVGILGNSGTVETAHRMARASSNERGFDRLDIASRNQLVTIAREVEIAEPRVLRSDHETAALQGFEVDESEAFYERRHDENIRLSVEPL